MTIGLLLKTNQIEIKGMNINDIGFIGELSLNGKLRSCSGILSMVMEAKNRVIKTVIIPKVKEVNGQSELIRYIQIAVAGGHNILMVGSPGCGKSMIAKRIPAILPEMSKEEALEVTKIYSVVNTDNLENLIEERPFRAPLLRQLSCFW